MPKISPTLWFLLSCCFIYSDLSAQERYELNWQQDGVLLGIGLPAVYFSYRLDRAVPPLVEAETEGLKPTDIPVFDRTSLYQYSERAADVSDILIYTCLSLPLTLLFSEEIRADAGIVYSMYGESLIYGTSLPLLSKGLFPRFRPYVYNPDVPASVKLTSEARKSFFSGHTSIAFTSMIFFASVYSRYHQNSSWKPFIWTSSVLLASSVGYLRIAAGAHFPSDVLVGALVGSLIGYFIPKIHETDPAPGMYLLSGQSYTKRVLNLSFAF